MKKRTLLLRGGVDGVVNAFFLDFLEQFLLSPLCAERISAWFWFSLIFSIASICCFVALIKGISKTKDLFITSMYSVILFHISTLLIIFNHLTIKLRWFSVAEVNNANGITILFSFGAYIVLTLLSKGCVLVVKCIKAKHR